MKKILFILIGLGITVLLFGQNGGCGFMPDSEYLEEWSNPESVKNKRLNYIKENWSGTDVYNLSQIEYENGEFNAIEGSPDAAVENNYYTVRRPIVNIAAHIVRRSNGSDGFAMADLEKAVHHLNNYYVRFRIQFQLCEVNYIDDDTAFNHVYNSNTDSLPTNTGMSANVLNTPTRNKAGKINIYFIPTSNTSWTWRPNRSPKHQHILMWNFQAKDRVTLPHEMGHWFDLIHTHGGGAKDSSLELVKRSNCETEGDLLCDTPADPGLEQRVYSSCFFDWRQTGKDSNGDYYWPDTRNIMSYSIPSCVNRFSMGQILRMQAAFLFIQLDRGYYFAPCSNPVQAATTKKVEISWAVPLIARTNDENGWAACIAMILSWRDHPVSYTPLQVENMKPSSGLTSLLYSSGIDLALFIDNGLLVEPANTYSAYTFADMLGSGPLYITSHPPGFKFSPEADDKMVVVTGMEGDGTPQGTFVTYHNPAPDGRGETLRKSFKDFIDFQEEFWLTDSEAPGAVFMVHP